MQQKKRKFHLALRTDGMQPPLTKNKLLSLCTVHIHPHTPRDSSSFSRAERKKSFPREWQLNRHYKVIDARM